MKIVYNYRWKELTQDGLLKDPEDCGPYYDPDNVNGWSGGYTSEKEAEEAFIKFTNKHPWNGYFHGLVLVKTTMVRDD